MEGPLVKKTDKPAKRGKSPKSLGSKASRIAVASRGGGQAGRGRPRGTAKRTKSESWPEWTETTAYAKLKKLGYGRGSKSIWISNAVAQAVGGDARLARLLGFLDSWHQYESYVGLAINRDGLRRIETTCPDLSQETGMPERTVRRDLEKLQAKQLASVDPQKKKLYIIPTLGQPGTLDRKHGTRIPDIVFLLCDKKPGPAWVFAQMLYRMDKTKEGKFRAEHRIKGRRCFYNSRLAWSKDLVVPETTVNTWITWLIEEKKFVEQIVRPQPGGDELVTFYSLNDQAIEAELDRCEKQFKLYVKARKKIFYKKIPPAYYSEDFQGAMLLLEKRRARKWYTPTPMEIDILRGPSPSTQSAFTTGPRAEEDEFCNMLSDADHRMREEQDEQKH